MQETKKKSLNKSIGIFDGKTYFSVRFFQSTAQNISLLLMTVIKCENKQTNKRFVSMKNDSDLLLISHQC